MKKAKDKKYPDIRTQYIVNASKHLTPAEISNSLKDEGFVKISRSRVWQILKANNINPLVKRYEKFN